jgi:MFS family permease
MGFGPNKTLEPAGHPAHNRRMRTSNPALTRTMWFFAIVYAVEGIGQAKIGILWQPLQHWLKETMHWTPVTISASLAILDLPWVIKPLWGAISDFVPIFGYRRRPYLVLANLAALAAFARVATLDTVGELIPALTVTAIAMAVSSTLCGALLVETGQKTKSSGGLVNQQWLAFNIAQLVSALAAGYLIEISTPTGALHIAGWIASVAPLAIVGAVWLIPEEKAGIDLEALKARLRALLSAFRSRDLWFVAGFLFLYYFSPGFTTPLYFQMSDQLGFSQGFIGALASIGAAGWIVGGVIYKWRLQHLSRLTLMRLSIIGGVVSTLSYLLLSGPAIAVAIVLLGGMTSMIAMIATMTLAAEACPQGAEGFAFAAMMSVYNLTFPLSDTLGSVLYEHVFNQHLTPLILLSASTTGLVFFLVPLMLTRRGVLVPG